MNPYEVLGVSTTAGEPEIKDAYRELVKKFHPDRNPSPDAHGIIAQINAAYEILSDSEKRAAYDNRGQWYQEVVAEQEDPKEVYRREYLKRKREAEIKHQEDSELATRTLYRISWWANVPVLLFSLFVVVDNYLPSQIFEEVANYGGQERRGGSRHGKQLVSVMATEHFEFIVPHHVHLSYDYYDDNRPKLHIEVTPIQKAVKNVSLELNGEYISLFRWILCIRKVCH